MENGDKEYGYDEQQAAAPTGEAPRAQAASRKPTPRVRQQQRPAKQGQQVRAPQERQASANQQAQQVHQARQAGQTSIPHTQRQVPSGGFVPATERASRQAQMGLQSAYDQYSRMNVGYSGRKKGSSRGKKVGIVLLIVVLLAAVAAGGAYAYKEMRKAEVNADLHSMDKEELEAIDSELTGNTDFSDPFTMLLLGSDERTEDPEMGARTDTIILVRIDPDTKAVSMVSIPRDTMVQIDGVGTAKINSAYYYGGAAGTIAAVKNLTGVDIDHYASVNFDELVQLVDAIGGIDVYVDERIDDWKAGDAIVEAGQQHLNGEQALVLARSRDYADGDYTRQVNQRKVIMGIVEKVMNAPATDLAGLIKASTGFLQTDSGIDFDWIFSLADQMRHTNTETPLVVTSTTLPSTAAYIGEVSYVIADTAATAELMQIFMACGDVSQPLTQSSISTDLANAGGTYTAPAGATTEEVYYEETYQEEYYYEEPAGEAYVEEPVVEEPVAEPEAEVVVDEGAGE